MVEYLSSQGFMTMYPVCGIIIAQTHCSYLTECFLFNTVYTTIYVCVYLCVHSNLLALFNIYIYINYSTRYVYSLPLPCPCAKHARS